MSCHIVNRFSWKVLQNFIWALDIRESVKHQSIVLKHKYLGHLLCCVFFWWAFPCWYYLTKTCCYQNVCLLWGILEMRWCLYLFYSISAFIFFLSLPVYLPEYLNTKLITFLLFELKSNIGLEACSSILYYKSLAGFCRTENKLVFVRLGRLLLHGYLSAWDE